MSDNPFAKLDNAFKEAVKKYSSKKDTPFGGLSLKSGADLSIESNVPYGIPTGIPELDLIIRGGYPAGKIVELYGFEFCGKTTAALQAARECQKKSGLVIWVDTERAWDAERAVELGLDLQRIHVFTADTIESTIAALDLSLSNLEVDVPLLLVVDSITGVPTETEMEAYLTKEARVGQEAKQIRRGIRMLVKKLAQKKAAILFINHAIAKIGVAYGKQSEAAGGHALKFWSTIRLEFQSKSTMRDKDKNRIGQEIVLSIMKLRGRLKKRKLDSIELLDDIGFNAMNSLLQASVETGFIDRKSTRTFVIGDQEFLKEDWHTIVEHNGGYDSVYKQWRKDAISKGLLVPWGSSRQSGEEE